MKNYMLFAVAFCSCSLFKNTRTEMERTHQLSANQKDYHLMEQKGWLSKSGSITFYKDTNHVDYTIQIWPKGMFSYSQEKGFTGEADRVMIKGSASASSAFSDSNTLEQRDKSKVELNLSQKDKQVTDDQKKVKTSSYSWKLILTGLGVILIIGWVLYRKVF